MLKRWFGAFCRQMRLAFALTLAVTVAGGVFSYVTTLLDEGEMAEREGVAQQSAAESSTAAWGDRILADVAHHMSVGLPIQVANACGLGASSCFRCHNGKRAAAPGSDPEKNPWHVQHKSVNNSCGGCHKGNPRLMKKEISHEGLIAKPVEQPENACVGCHADADLAQLVDSYKKLTK